MVGQGHHVHRLPQRQAEKRHGHEQQAEQFDLRLGPVAGHLAEDVHAHMGVCQIADTEGKHQQDAVDVPLHVLQDEGDGIAGRDRDVCGPVPDDIDLSRDHIEHDDEDQRYDQPADGASDGSCKPVSRVCEIEHF